MAHIVVAEEGRFELREYTSKMGPVTVTGFCAWDTNCNESVGPGLVPTLREAQLLMEMGHASVRQENIRLRQRLAHR